MNRIKILHILATNRFSGAESVVCDIITNSSKKYEHVYCSVNGPIEDVLTKKHIKHELIKKLNRKNVNKIIKSYNPDIIHAHDFRASFVASVCKHNSILISHIHNNSLWLQKVCINSIVFLITSLRSNKVLVVSDSIRDEYVFKRFILKKITCIGNPVMRSKITSRIDTNKKENIYDICCVARISEAKNPFLFLSIINELVKINPEIKVIWVGDGELKEIVKNKSKELNLDKNLRFLGFKENPYDYIYQSKLFLLTSKWEGYGLVAFEALTLGKPCVVSNVGGLKNIVDNNCGKLCNPDETTDFVNEINCLLTNTNYYKKKSIEAIKRSAILDNEKDYFKKLESIYSETIGRE